jgi:hypothetical protein
MRVTKTGIRTILKMVRIFGSVRMRDDIKQPDTPFGCGCFSRLAYVEIKGRITGRIPLR